MGLTKLSKLLKEGLVVRDRKSKTHALIGFKEELNCHVVRGPVPERPLGAKQTPGQQPSSEQKPQNHNAEN